MPSAKRAAPKNILGKTEPRLWTPPLRPLNRRTSHGYECRDFMENVAGEPFDPWQEWVVKHALELNPDGTFRFRIVLILVARQNGKALDADTEILTSRGFTAMRNIQVGDEVYHPSGRLTRVTAASEIMRDHDCYRVTTTDGRAVIADAGHLWTVTDRGHYTSLGPRGAAVRTYNTVTLTTAQMATEGTSRCKSGSRASVTGGKTYATNEYRFQLPGQQPIRSPDVELPIAPYTLGAWLGDGTSTGVGFTCADEEILDAIRQDGYSVTRRAARIQYAITNEPERARRIAKGFELVPAMGVAKAAAHVGVGKDSLLGLALPARRILTGAPLAIAALGPHKTMTEILRDLGVLGNKHVPDIYLTAGTSQREALLQGLMDTDGTIEAKRGQAEFCSTLRPLADAVLYLARSLGWRATLKTGRAMLNGRDCGAKYRVYFTPKTSDPFCPFRLPRKVARIGEIDGNKGRGTVSISSIESVEPRPVRCIQVDSPDGLFLAGRDLIPTHNSHLKRGVSLWRMYMHPKSRLLGVAQEVTLAREQWQMAQDTIHACPDLEAEWGNVRNTNGDEYFWLQNGSRYKIGAANRRAGRGGSNDEVDIDELREQRNWDAWAALSKTTMARDNSQIWLMSNAGDDESVVLNQLLDVARSETDSTIFLADYSAPDGCELDDWNAIRQANPNLGRRVSVQAIQTAMSTDPPNVFRTEVLCQRVDMLDGAIDTQRWNGCADAMGSLDAHRRHIAACFDVAPDGQHATLAVAARLSDGRARVEIAAAWTSTDAARAELPALIDRIRPVAFGWYPGGPAAGIATILRPIAMKYNKRPGGKRPGDPPEDGAIAGSHVTEACQELADLTKALRVVHPADPLLDSHIRSASKLISGDGWRFTRKGGGGPGGSGHVDAAYAAAGAVKLALTMPAPQRARVRMIS